MQSEPPPPPPPSSSSSFGDDSKFTKTFFAQFAMHHKQLDGDEEKFTERFTQDNAVLVLKKHSKKRERAKDPAVVEKRRLRKARGRMQSGRMPHRRLKEEGLYNITLGSRKYEDFLFMNRMWEAYMGKVLEHHQGKPIVVDTIGPRILKADFHGAYIRVTQSRSPTHVGLTGIILMEFRNSFRVITKTSRLLLIPKAGSVFVMRTCGFIVTLYGSQLLVRSSERSVGKFKSQESIDL